MSIFIWLLIICHTVNGSENLVLSWKEAISVSLTLPTTPSGYTSSPPLSSRLIITNSGELVSTGQLQASDAGTYNISSSDFTGVFIFSITSLNSESLLCVNY